MSGESVVSGAQVIARTVQRLEVGIPDLTVRIGPEMKGKIGRAEGLGLGEAENKDIDAVPVRSCSRSAKAWSTAGQRARR